MNFISDIFKEYLDREGIKEFTKIQEKTMPIIYEKNDVIGISETGSGKTLSYLLPVLSNLDETIKTPQVIIITPTHEIASQVFKITKELLMKKYAEKGVALIIGGANIKRQLEAVKLKPKVIVGSTGRILELINMKKLSVHNVKTIVIDEADRLLDKDNFKTTNELVKKTLKDRQLLFFSASMSQNSLEKAIEISKNAEIIRVEEEFNLPNSIEHLCFVCGEREKIQILRKIVHSQKIDKALVFLNDANQIEIFVKRLNYHGIKAAMLHGGVFAKERGETLRDFRNGQVTLLVASDIASRGLDIKGLDYVINLDVPENPEFYLHRAGRVGRMGKKGYSIVIATDYEKRFIAKLEKSFLIKIEEKEIKYGKII